MNSPLAMLLAQTDADAITDAAAVAGASSDGAGIDDLLQGYLLVFIIAFLVTLTTTPIMRVLAVKNGVVDNPGFRKAHAYPIAYLGGVAVFLGLMAGIAFSYFGPMISDDLFSFHESSITQKDVPPSVVLGMALIMLTGLIDDVVGLMPRLKIAGQLLAAAALAMENVGTKVAAGVLRPIGEFFNNPDLIYHIPMPADLPVLGAGVEIDVVYWVGTGIIAVFVLGACNASNLIDGLDGLLSGVTAIAAAGLLTVAAFLAHDNYGSLDGARIVIGLCLLGACLGFLPHNFNPASIFLGDCGSLLLGYVSIVMILSLGDTGVTHLVVAGLIIYAIPIIDTALAIIRRKMAGLPMSAPDDQHLHHMLKRALGVKGAVLTLYALGAVFATLGVWLSMWRGRLVFAIALVVVCFVGVYAVKVARRRVLEDASMKLMGGVPPEPQAATEEEKPTSSSTTKKPEPEPDAPSPV